MVLRTTGNVWRMEDSRLTRHIISVAVTGMRMSTSPYTHYTLARYPSHYTLASYPSHIKLS